MKFDVVIGNPPYNDEAKQQIYTDFYLQAMDISDFVCLIFPIGWQEPKNANSLRKLNNEKVKRDKQIVHINNIQNAFKGVPGAEWTNIILWRNGFDNGLEGNQLIFTNSQNSEVRKLAINKSEIEKPDYIVRLNDIVSNSKGFQQISEYISVRKPYGLSTDILKDWKKYNLPPLNENQENKDDIKVLTARGVKFVPNNYPFPQIGKAFNQFKVFVPYAWGNWDEKNGLGGSFADIIIGKPRDVCIETYLECGGYDTEEKAFFFAKYLMTQFARALLYVNKYSQHSTTAFGAIPYQEFKEEWWNLPIKEINERLFIKYNVPEKIKLRIIENIQLKDESNIIKMWEME